MCLALEAYAVGAIFDKTYEEGGCNKECPADQKAPGDMNTHTIGRIGPHGVVLVHISPPAPTGRSVIHFGTIASGDRDIRFDQDHDTIARVEKVIAFERGGAGAWDYLPCVVAEGVCHKDKNGRNMLGQLLRLARRQS
jgi:hypothetical protein